MLQKLPMGSQVNYHFKNKALIGRSSKYLCREQASVLGTIPSIYDFVPIRHQIVDLRAKGVKCIDMEFSFIISAYIFHFQFDLKWYSKILSFEEN